MKYILCGNSSNLRGGGVEFSSEYACFPDLFFVVLCIHWASYSFIADADILCVTSAFGVDSRRMLRIIQCFGKHCSCLLQGECMVVLRV
jgi:hypothetical protein